MENANSSDLSATESQEESKFAAVVFHNIQEGYIPGKDIRCCYSIKPSVSPTANDWIGLFKVGWQSHKDYLCYEYSPVVEGGTETQSTSSQKSVLFRGNKLPPEAEEIEFYQFCYVTSRGDVRGASYPFQIQFSKPGELECNEEEDENGDTLLVVHNRTTILEDSLAKALDEIAALKAGKEKSEADCVSFQDMILNLEGQKNDLHTQVEKQKRVLEKVMSEKTSVEETWRETCEKLKISEEDLNKARSTVLELEKVAEVEKLRCVKIDDDQKKLEEERLKLLQEISNGRSEMERLASVADGQTSKFLAMQGKMEKMTQENQALVKENEVLLNDVAETQTSLKEAKQASSAVEKSLAEQMEQMNLLQVENAKLKEELTAAQGEIDQLSVSLCEERGHLEEASNFEEQAKKLSKKLQENEMQLSARDETIQELNLLLKEEKEKLMEMIQDHEVALANVQQQLNEERAFNNSLSTASDHQVAELQEQLNIQLEKNSTACQQIEVKTQEVKRLEQEVKEKEIIILNTKQQFGECKEELQSAQNREQEYLQFKAVNEDRSKESLALEGPYYALQTAHAQVKKHYLQVKKENTDLWRQKTDLKRRLTLLQSDLPDSDLRFQMANLKKQIEDLRIRLNMGAEAYKAKFKECRKYQSELKKVQKGVSGNTTPPSPTSVAEFEMRNLKQSLENEKINTAAIKKTMENYKKDAHEANTKLNKVIKESEALQRKVIDLKKEVAQTNDEKQRRLDEDKELQSHIECLHQELQSRTEKMAVMEQDYKKAVDDKESLIATLTERNQSLQEALDSEEDAREVSKERNVLQEEVIRQKKLVEDLHYQLQQKTNCEVSLLQKISEMEQAAEQANQTLNENEGLSSAPLTNESDCDENSSGTRNNNMCPVCSMCFPPTWPMTNIQDHVNSHFPG